MNYVNLILYVLIIYMIFKIYVLRKIQNKNKQLFDVIKHVEDEEYFFKRLETILETAKDHEYIARANVTKLWGICMYKRWNEFETTLNDIVLEDLIKQNMGRISIEYNEDSFVYLYIIIPDILYNNNRQNERDLLKDKMSSVDEKLNKQLCLAISKANDDFFENKNDRGLAFYEKVLNAEYGEYSYSKQLIGLYKSLIGTQAAIIYREKGDIENYKNQLEYVKLFSDTKLGKRWIKGLNVELPELNEQEEKINDEELEDEDVK